MKIRFLLLLMILLSTIPLTYTQSYTPTQANLESRKLFQDMKYGMFIHWGASSILGHGEWVMNNRNIHVSEYKKLVNVFDPHLFNAQEWVSLAKSSGMKYITFITRHHDGFSNWDTRYSDWKITKTPYGKDLLKQLSDECKKQDIKLILYYSLLDWSRDDYQYSTGKTGKGTGRTKKEPWQNYLDFMNNQLTELLTNYGEISGIWLDGHWDQLDNDHDKSLKSKVDWKYDIMYSLIHKLQPKCLIGNNHHLTPIPGEDFQMFEKDLPGQNTTGFGGADISALPLESCETMNDNWGYSITDRNFKSSEKLIKYLVNAAGRNANFLLNIGPRPDGTIQEEFKDTLAVVGKWLQKNGESIYGTRGNVYPVQNWGVITHKQKTYYLHILDWSKIMNPLFLTGFNYGIKDITMLRDNTKVTFKQQEEGTFIYLKDTKPDPIDTIIKIELK